MDIMLHVILDVFDFMKTWSEISSKILESTVYLGGFDVRCGCLGIWINNCQYEG